MRYSNTVPLALLVFVAVAVVACGLESTAGPSATISPKQYRWINCLDIEVYNSPLTMSILSVTNGIVFVGGNGGLHAYLRALDVETGSVIGSLNYSVPLPNGVTVTGIFVTGAVDPATETFITYVLTPFTVSAFSGPAYIPKWTTQIYAGSLYQQPLLTGRFLCIPPDSSNFAACYRTEDGSLEWTGSIGSTSPLLGSEEMMLVEFVDVSGFNITSGTTLWSTICNDSYPNGYPSCSGPLAVSNGMIFYRKAVLSLSTGKLAWSLDQYTAFGGYMTFSTSTNVVLMLNSTNTVVAYDTRNGRLLWASTIPSTYPNYVPISYLKTDNFKSFVIGGTTNNGFTYMTGNLMTGELSGWKTVATPVTPQGLFSAGSAGAVAFANSPLQEYCVIGL
jgi:outer membrane protein assembly factor BamB